MYYCKYCGIQYKTNQARNGHQVHCKLNPNSSAMQAKIKQTIKNSQTKRQSKRHQYTKYCQKCGKEYSVFITDRANQNKNYKLHCSTSCSNSRMHSDQTKTKISQSMLKNPKQIKICICGTQFKSNNKYCSRQCAYKFASGNTGMKYTHKPGSKSGGLRDRGGRSVVYQYINWLGQIMYLNKEQIIVAKLFDQNKLQWSRNKTGFPYIDMDGNSRKFYPDFKVNQKYIQYKGWVTEQMQHKMKDSVIRNNLPLIIVVGSKRFQKYGIVLEQFKQKFTSLV